MKIKNKLYVSAKQAMSYLKDYRFSSILVKYFSNMAMPSENVFKSCALNGVTRLESIMPFVIPIINQTKLMTPRAKIRRLTKQTKKYYLETFETLGSAFCVFKSALFLKCPKSKIGITPGVVSVFDD